MWSNFFLQQDDDGRGGMGALGGAGSKSGRTGKRARPPRMSDSEEGKIKLAFFFGPYWSDADGTWHGHGVLGGAFPAKTLQEQPDM